MSTDWTKLMEALEARVEHAARLLGGERSQMGLPAVYVDGLCTVEVGADGYQVCTRLTREEVLKYDLSRLGGHEFEAYAARNISVDLYKPGEPREKLAERLKNMPGCDAFFTFAAQDDGELLALTALLRAEGFHIEAETA